MHSASDDESLQVSTAEGPDGDWSNWTLCPEGQLIKSPSGSETETARHGKLLTGQSLYGFRSQGHSYRPASLMRSAEVLL